MDTKICRYCGKLFSEIDSPQSFHRMITCRDIGCMGQRRRELWKKRNCSPTARV